MLFALGFIAQFTIGGLSGVMHSIVPADTQQTDTYFVVAHFHYVLFGGLVFAIFGGFYYWWPKVFGKMLDETLGKLNFWLMVIGFNLTFFPMHFLGFEGQPRRTYTYPDGMGWGALNLMATIGAFVIALSVLVFLVNVIFTTRRGPSRARRPVGRAHARVVTSSPPPEYNFAEVPIVEHRDEFWHRKYTEDDEGRLVKLPRSEAAVDHRARREPGEPHNIHMPSPSYWPFVLALGLPIIGYGFVFKNWWLLAIGALVMFFGITAWAIEPATDGAAPLMAQAVVTSGESSPVVAGTNDRASDRTPGSATTSSRSGCSSSSESLFFGAFIATYFLYRGRDAGFLKGPTPDEPAQHSVHVGHVVHPADELAHDGARARRDPAGRPPAAPHLAPRDRDLRHDFIAGQVYEFTEFYREGLHLGTNLFGTTFFVLTGLHGAHVTIGIVWLLSLWGRSMQGTLPAEQARGSGDRRSVLALRRHRVDLHLHRDLLDSPALAMRIP